MALKCAQRPGSVQKAPESLGFRRLAVQGFPEWVGRSAKEWPGVDLDEVEWSSDSAPDAWPLALLVRVFGGSAEEEDAEEEHYESPLDTDYAPLLAQWSSWSAKNIDDWSSTWPTAKAVFKPDKLGKQCDGCERPMGRTTDAQTGVVFRRRHHCRACGGVFCDACSSHKLESVPGYLHQKPQRVCDGCHHAMTFLGSLEQRRASTTGGETQRHAPTSAMPMTPSTGNATAVGGAGADDVWVVGGKLEVFSKKVGLWCAGTIRSLPDKDLVEVSYTIVDGSVLAQQQAVLLGQHSLLPRLKLSERSSPRLRWPDGLAGVTSKTNEKRSDLLTVTANGDARLGLNFGKEGRTFPVVESIEPGSLVATQCPDVQQGMIVVVVEGATTGPIEVERMSADDAAQAFVTGACDLRPIWRHLK